MFAVDEIQEEEATRDVVAVAVMMVELTCFCGYYIPVAVAK